MWAVGGGAMRDKHHGPADPWRALGVAVIQRAVRDAQRGDVGARSWLVGDPLARSLADALGVSRSAVIRAVVESTNGAGDG